MPVFGSAEKYPGFSYVEPEMQNPIIAVNSDDECKENDEEEEVATPE